jgi:HAD superfamily hydrolase (TIGR01509 family)
MIAHYFTGRRPSDIFAAIETATQRQLPADFATVVAAATLQRLSAELHTTPHAEYALTWLRGPKCVASSSSMDRVEVSLECTGLTRFFGPNLFSASEVPHGKPAPDLFLHVAARIGVQPADCIVVEDAPAGVAAARAAGMTPIGFVGGRHAGPNLAAQLTAAGAQVVIADLRALKATVVELRGW